MSRRVKGYRPMQSEIPGAFSNDMALLGKYPSMAVLDGQDRTPRRVIQEILPHQGRCGRKILQRGISAGRPERPACAEPGCDAYRFPDECSWNAGGDAKVCVSDMTAPLFSVVTVVRNAEADLRLTAETLARQSFRDFVWDIIDGDSTDATKDFVLAQLESGVATGVSEADNGIFDAMNKGLARAVGTYVLFLNAGDRLFDDQSLETAARELQAGGLPDIGFFGSIMDFGDRKFVRKVKPPSYISHGQPGLHQATFVRTELHRRFPFRLNFPVVADYDALARMATSDITMKSFAPIVSVNDFEVNANSNRYKFKLIKEAAQVQRSVLKLSRTAVAASVARRSVNSAAAKALTAIRALKGV